MPENIPFDGAALRAQALEDLSRAEEETEAELVVASFREGMSAGLDFAYRVVQDFRESRYSHREREILDRALEVLVSEHDMRSAQPIRAIQAERAGIQAADAMLTGLSEALMTVQPTPDPGPTTMNLAEPPTCDGPCCRPEADPDNVFNWVNMNPDHTSAPTPITSAYVRCMCGDVNMSHRLASQVLLRGVYHRASAPCYVADDPEPENVQAASDERAALRLEHSCDCGEISGLVSGQVSVPRADGWVIVHRPQGEPCATGIDLVSPTISLEES